jgi:hypothetical protein
LAMPRMRLTISRVSPDRATSPEVSSPSALTGCDALSGAAGLRTIPLRRFAGVPARADLQRRRSPLRFSAGQSRCGGTRCGGRVRAKRSNRIRACAHASVARHGNG